MKNIPEKVWLQVNPVHEDVKDFNELHGITWHKEKVFFTDIEYTRSVNTDEDMQLFLEWSESEHWWRSTDTRFPQTIGMWTKKINGDFDPAEGKSTADLLKLFREEKEKQKQRQP